MGSAVVLSYSLQYLNQGFPTSNAVLRRGRRRRSGKSELMFREYFGIEENPFSNTPDPSYLYLSERHQEALAHLQYGVKGTSGFVLLTGEVGTGKTTVSRCLVEQLPDNIDLAMCLNPRLTEAELLATICDELAISRENYAPNSVKDHMDALNRHLLKGHANGRRAVLIIDEAQNLSTSLLEQVRLLTNLETASTKLLQIILIGQPELRGTLERNDMRQLSQRITARYHLEPMTRPETDKYIRHRLWVGKLPVDLIQPGALSVIYDHSGGVPRLINSICERCLLGAYATNMKTVDASLVHTAAHEVLGGPMPAEAASLDVAVPASLKRAVAVAMAAAVVLGTAVLSQRDRDTVRAFASAASEPAMETASKPAPLIAGRAAQPKPAPAPVPAPERATEPAPEPETAAAPEIKPPPEQTAPPVVTVNADEEALKAVSRLIAEGLVTTSKPPPEIPTAPKDPLPEQASAPEMVDEKPLPETVAKTAALETGTETGGPPSSPKGDKIFETLFNLRRTLSPGMSGRDVAWLRIRLGKILNTPATEEGRSGSEKKERDNFFGEELKKKVLAFQKNHGLKADGIVGIRTRIQLGATSGSATAPVPRKQK